MALFDRATNATSTPIVPQDRFIVECLNVEEAPPYAPPGEQPKPGARCGIRWVLGLYYPADGSRFHFQDEPYEFFQTTTANMQRGARARELAEAFLGREIREDEQLSPDMVIGKKLVGMVIHELSRDKSKKNAKLVAPEPYRAEPVRRPSPSQVSDNPSEEEVDRALLVGKLEKQVARLMKLDEDAGSAAQKALSASTLETCPMDAIEDLLAQVNTAIKAAMES